MTKPILIIGTGHNIGHHDYVSKYIEHSNIKEDYHVVILPTIPEDYIELFNAEKLEPQDVTELYEKLKDK